MRQLLFVLTFAGALTLAFGGIVLADHGAPVGGCPDGSELHHMMENQEHMHNHIGSDVDRNDDGFLCVKHVGKDDSYHVHIDNYVPCDPKPKCCVVVEHDM